MVKEKQAQKSKVNITNIFGVLGALSGLATGAFLLFAELNKCSEATTICPVVYDPYEIWKVVAIFMFLTSAISWTAYLIFTKRNSTKKK